MQANDLKKLIESHLPDAVVTVTSPDNVHFTAEIVSPSFAGKSRLQQQQMIYQYVNTYIQSGEIHALSLKTRES